MHQLSAQRACRAFRSPRAAGLAIVLLAMAGCDPVHSTSSEIASDAAGAIQAEASTTERADPPDAAGNRGLDAGTQAASGTDSRQPEPPAPRGRWMTYGYDLENSQYNPDESVLNASNVAGLREKWRLRVPDGATSTPAVYEGTAYFGGWDGHVWAVDAESGEIRWQRRVTPTSVRSSPLVTEERVYAAGLSSLFALDRKTGALIFEARLHPHPLAFIDSSPKLVAGLVITGVASFANALPFTDQSDPALAPFIGSVVAVDAQSGEEVWRVATTGGESPCIGGSGSAVWSSAAIDEERELLFIGTGQGYEEPASTCSDSLLAIHYARAHQGPRIAWIAQFTQGDAWGLATLLLGKDDDVGAAPNLFTAGGRALVGVGDKGGSYRAFDRSTGALVWRKDLAHAEDGIGGVMTTAAFHGDTLYVASNEMKVGTFLQSDDDDPSDTAVLYALDTATGDERWTVDLPSPVIGTFALANGLLYHPTVDRTVYARDIATGKDVWHVKLEARPGAGPSVVDGRLFVSAGLAIAGTTTHGGGFVASFGLGEGPSMVRDAAADPVTPLSEAECRAAVPADFSAECTACVCACDATAAGHAGLGWSIAPCMALLCDASGSADETRTCVQESCGLKLLPSFVVDGAVGIGPCIDQCAVVCGLWL